MKFFVLTCCSLLIAFSLLTKVSQSNDVNYDEPEVEIIPYSEVPVGYQRVYIGRTAANIENLNAKPSEGEMLLAFALGPAAGKPYELKPFFLNPADESLGFNVFVRNNAVLQPLMSMASYENAFYLNIKSDENLNLVSAAVKILEYEPDVGMLNLKPNKEKNYVIILSQQNQSPIRSKLEEYFDEKRSQAEELEDYGYVPVYSSGS